MFQLQKHLHFAVLMPELGKATYLNRCSGRTFIVKLRDPKIHQFKIFNRQECNQLVTFQKEVEWWLKNNLRNY